MTVCAGRVTVSASPGRVTVVGTVTVVISPAPGTVTVVLQRDWSGKWRLAPGSTDKGMRLTFQLCKSGW